MIQGYANMLSRWGKDDEKILDESICAIQNEAEHMNHLVEQLLFLARGDSGKTSVRLETVELSDLMEEVYEESFMIDEAHPYRCRKSDSACLNSHDFVDSLSRIQPCRLFSHAAEQLSIDLLIQE